MGYAHLRSLAPGSVNRAVTGVFERCASIESVDMDLPSAAVEVVVGELRGAGSVFAEDEAAILVAAARTPDELTGMIHRRMNGDPLEYIVGWAEFCGRRVAVSPGVFVPRQRSKLMVEQALAVSPAPRRLLDLCCGTGAIGVAIAARVADVEVVAVDIDPTAVDCARHNLASFHATCYTGDLFAALPAELRAGFDLIVANAPYVPSDSVQYLPPEARLYEPAFALDGGADGLDVHRRIAADVGDWLSSDGGLVIETGADQAPAATAVLQAVGLATSVITDDDLFATVVIATRRTASVTPRTI